MLLCIYFECSILAILNVQKCKSFIKVILVICYKVQKYSLRVLRECISKEAKKRRDDQLVCTLSPNLLDHTYSRCCYFNICHVLNLKYFSRHSVVCTSDVHKYCNCICLTKQTNSSSLHFHVK